VVPQVSLRTRGTATHRIDEEAKQNCPVAYLRPDSESGDDPTHINTADA